MADPSEVHLGVGQGVNSENSESNNSGEDFHNLDIVSLAKSPVNIEALEHFSVNYDKTECTFLIKGFSSGFPIQYNGPRLPRDSKNLRSVSLNPDIIRKQLKKEVEAGRVAGPFAQRPFQNLIVSPIGLVPKKNPGEYRMIHHLSYPEGESINDYIDPASCSVQYTSFDEAVKLVQILGRNCKLFKSDIKSAYRLIPIRPEDFELLGFKFNENFYFDKALPFGASISCITFERFARFLEFCVKSRLNTENLIHYLDDFLGGGKTTDSCAKALETFKNTMSELGVPVAVEKTEGPSEVLVFLGLELDSNEMVVRIPQEKIQEVLEKTRVVLSTSKTTLRKMQSLIGSLNFCCRAIIIGRPFTRRLINSICGISQPFHHIRIKKDIRLDLDMWQVFLKNFNGISVFHDRFWVTNEDVQLFSDSAGGQGLGFGAYYKGHWCQDSWPNSWHNLEITSDITTLELFPILVALFVWGHELRNKKLKINCDNIAVVHILNKLTSKSERVMCLVRALTLRCLSLNILLKATHVPGCNNNICDALSRFQLVRFRELAPDADLVSTPVPDYLWNIFNLELDSCFTQGLHQTHN